VDYCVIAIKMDKIKLNNDRKKKPQFIKKKNAPQRPSIVSNYSVVSLSDVTEESLEVWRGETKEKEKI
jgi:GTP-binding protein EngB required for normal cell division